MNNFCEVLKVLGKENRLNIAVHLLNGESSVSELGETLGIAQPSLSHELKILRSAELVSTRRESKSIHYALANSEVYSLVSGLANLAGLSPITSSVKFQSHSDLQFVQTVQQYSAPSSVGECGSFPKIA